VLYDKRYELLRQELQNLRRAAAMTQGDIARLLGHSQSYVSKIESGEQYLDVIVFVDWCEALKADPSKLLEHIQG
jgi:transcriptional regulator with XRE-family HTH domain